MSDWTFVHVGHWPWLLLLPAAMVAGWWWQQRAAEQRRHQLGNREQLLVGCAVHGRLRAILATFAAALWAIALLGPVAPGSAGRLAPDVVLCVDLSRSMAAADIAPTRFARLRAEVERLIEVARGSRFCLLVFAGEVQPIAPLTADGEAIVWLLDEAAIGTLPGGTDLGAAIEAAAQLLQRADTVGDIVLLTDGEDFAGAGRSAAAAARVQGNRVHCVGIGTVAGSKIVVDDGEQQRFLQDAAGNDVVTRLDVPSLTAIAAAGGGRFVAVDRADRSDALATLWREDLQPHAADVLLARGNAVGRQQYQWPLLGGFVLWMLRLWLRERRR